MDARTEVRTLCITGTGLSRLEELLTALPPEVQPRDVAARNGRVQSTLLKHRRALLRLFQRVEDARLLHETMPPELAFALGVMHNCTDPDRVARFLQTCARRPEDPLAQRWVRAVPLDMTRVALRSEELPMWVAMSLMQQYPETPRANAISARTGLAAALLWPTAAMRLCQTHRASWTPQQRAALLFRGLPLDWVMERPGEVPQLVFWDEHEALDIHHAVEHARQSL